MAITDSTGTFSSGILIGDPVNGYPATPTLVNVNGVDTPISSVLELQSTDKAFALPRMTTGELAAIPVTCDGMMAYNSSIDSAVCLSNGVWQSELSTFHFAPITVSRAQILAMDGAPVVILAAPADPNTAIVVLKATIVNVFNTTAFAAGAAVTLEYAGTAINALSGTIAAAFVNTAGPGNVVVSLYGSSGGAAGDIIVASDIAGLGLELNTTVAFTGGHAGSSLQVNIWYALVGVA